MKILKNLKVLYISKYDHDVDYFGWCLLDALEYFGATVYCCDPRIKWQTKQFIQGYGVNMIFVDEDHGMDRLPIKIINKNGTLVFIKSNDDSVEIDIDHKFIIPKLLKYPIGNIFATPDQRFENDIVIVFNHSDKPLLITKWVVPIVNRLLFLNRSVYLYGCDLLGKFNLPYRGPIGFNDQNLINLYGNSKIHVNIQDENYVSYDNMVLHGAFCGGFPINNFLYDNFVGSDSVTSMIKLIESYLQDTDKLREDKTSLLNNGLFKQSNIKLLSELLGVCGYEKFVDTINQEADRLSVKHEWELNAGGFYG